MKQEKASLMKSQQGAVLNEYVMILGILIAIFVVFGIVLRRVTIERGRSSIQAVTQVSPNGRCPEGTILTADECL